MTEHQWIRVTPKESIPPREGRVVCVGARDIAIFNLGAGEQFLAIDNRCPHKGGPLSDGIVTGTSVVCPLHAWKIDLATGCVEWPAASQDACVSTYPTRVEDGIIVVCLPVASVVEQVA
jgi:nitrite reductase (NADH) small subunit